MFYAYSKITHQYIYNIDDDPEQVEVKFTIILYISNINSER